MSGLGKWRFGGRFSSGMHIRTAYKPQFEEGAWVKWRGERATVLSCGPVYAVIDLGDNYRKQVRVDELTCCPGRD